MTPQFAEDARRARGLWRHTCAEPGSWSRETTQRGGRPCVLIASVRTHCASTTSVQGLSMAAAGSPSVHPQQCSHGGGTARSRPEPCCTGVWTTRPVDEHPWTVRAATGSAVTSAGAGRGRPLTRLDITASPARCPRCQAVRMPTSSRPRRAPTTPLASSRVQLSGLVSGHVEGRTGVHRQVAHRRAHHR